MSEPVGFIGLGINGHGMIRNLLKVRFDFSIWLLGQNPDYD
jgi:3-hydroxyisobutyrate dehydrogenase-like beta-hydroxyacid dehydrogenase